MRLQAQKEMKQLIERFPILEVKESFNDYRNSYEGEDKKERSDYRVWAQSLGWSSRKISNRLIL